MSLRNPSRFWRKVIVGTVYAVVGVIAGLLLGLIPERIVVLMAIGGLFGAWAGSRMESTAEPPRPSSLPDPPATRTNGRRSPESR
jgi:hypothetical protein